MKNNEIDKIKQFPITALLESLNFSPAAKSGGELYYISPLRPSEKTPSFCVNERKNCWFDHGMGPDHKGGDIIDLVQQLLGLDFNNAVQALTQISNNPALIGLAEAPKPVIPKEREYKSTLEMAGPPQNQLNLILWNYLEKDRGINIQLVQRSPVLMGYLKQIDYQVKGRPKTYYAVGWKNSAGGYELRSRGFQSFIGKSKEITFIKGHVPGCAVFEGFLDYLSALTYFHAQSGATSLGYDVLVLNSTRLVKKALPILKAQPKLSLFLDNDRTGLKTIEYIKQECKYLPAEPGQEELQEREIKTFNHIYEGYKDFNDYLTKTKPDKPLPGTTNDTCSQRSQQARWWLWVKYRETQYTKDGKPFDDFPFYSFNNHQSGYDALLQLRQELEHKIVFFRLCERTTGREFKILEESRV